jgi:uncharacterized protein YaiI (UPF0178 family)
MRILVDADGCPVVDIAIDEAVKNGLECILICDTAHIFERSGAETVTVSKGADSADFKLVNMIRRGDIAVTQDYGLAAMCLARGAKALHQNGLIYTDGNIDSLLLSRHTARRIRAAGGRLKGPRRRTRQQDDDFRTALRQMIKDAKN